MRLRPMIQCLPLMISLVMCSVFLQVSHGEDIDICTTYVNSAEESMGVNAVEDLSCIEDPSDTLGCFRQICRRCRLPDYSDEAPEYRFCSDIIDDSSIHSNSSANDPALNVSCPSLVSKGDKAVGITAEFDELCSTVGGLGCFGVETNTSCRMCKIMETPQSRHLNPCLDVPLNASSNSSSGSVSVGDYLCPELVSVGDASVGISAYFDEDCLEETGIGCFPPTDGYACRYCKTKETKESMYFLPCDDDMDSSDNFVIDECAAQTSEGNNNVGISAFVDESCEQGGLGCFVAEDSSSSSNLICRYCQFQETDQSRHLLSCPRKPQDDMTDFCPSKVPVGDKTFGISAYLDMNCVDGGLGCFPEGNCRFCRIGQQNEKNDQFVPCPIDCQMYVDETSYSSVSFIIDDRCAGDASSELPGCEAGTSCRLCHTSKKSESSDLLYCEVLEGLKEILAKDGSGSIAEATGVNTRTQNGSEDNLQGSVYWVLAGIFTIALVVAIFSMFLISKHRARSNEERVEDVPFVNKLDSHRIATL